MEIKNILSKEMDSYAKLERKQSIHAEDASRKTALAAHSRDRATVSPEAKLRGEAFAAALAAPDTRSAKVDELKTLVENGEYHVDTRAIATKMLEEDYLLFG